MITHLIIHVGLEMASKYLNPGEHFLADITAEGAHLSPLFRGRLGWPRFPLALEGWQPFV